MKLDPVARSLFGEAQDESDDDEGNDDEFDGVGKSTKLVPKPSPTNKPLPSKL